MSEQQPRAFQMSIEIAAPPDAVWRALVEAEELVRWFPLDAQVTPGDGGRWVISWDGQWRWSTDIEIWEPGRHLRVVDRAGRPYDAEGKAALGSAAPMEIAIDWRLEGQGGTTMLRLVHAGFGRGGAWDDEYDGVSVGWQLELRGLKHYLERHRGKDRRSAWNRCVAKESAEALWARLTGPAGLLEVPAEHSLRPGVAIVATLSTGDRIEGEVVVSIPARALQVTVVGLNDALYRLWIDRVGEQVAVNSWLSAYGIGEGRVRDFHDRMQRELQRVVSSTIDSAEAAAHVGQSRV